MLTARIGNSRATIEGPTEPIDDPGRIQVCPLRAQGGGIEVSKAPVESSRVSLRAQGCIFNRTWDLFLGF